MGGYMRPLLGRWPRTVSESRLGSHEKQASEQCFSLAFGHLPPACCPCFRLWLPSVDCDLGYMKQTNLSPPWAAFGRCFYHGNRKQTDTYWRFDPWVRRRDWCFRWSFDRHIHAINKYTQIHVQKGECRRRSVFAHRQGYYKAGSDSKELREW